MSAYCGLLFVGYLETARMNARSAPLSIHLYVSVLWVTVCWLSRDSEDERAVSSSQYISMSAYCGLLFVGYLETARMNAQSAPLSIHLYVSVLWVTVCWLSRDSEDERAVGSSINTSLCQRTVGYCLLVI